MGSVIQGFDELRNSQGVLIAPLGFGFQNDWEEIDRVSGSAVASLDSVFWDEGVYEDIEVVFIDMQVATDTANLTLLISTDGSTFDSGASDYDTIIWGERIAGAEFTNEDADAAFMEITRNQGDLTGEEGFGYARLMACDTTTEHVHMWGRSSFMVSDGTWCIAKFAGRRKADAAVRGVQIIASTGNITGSFVVRGRRKTPVSLISQDDWVVIEDRTGIVASSNEDFFWDDQVYDQIEVQIDNLTVDTDNIDVDLLLSTDGSTFLVGATDYVWAWTNVNDSAGTGAAGSTGTDARIRLAPFCGNVAGEFRDVTIRFNNVSGVASRKTLEFSFAGNPSAGTMDRGNGSAYVDNGDESIRGFSIDPASTAVFSAYRIRVRGRRLTPVGVLKQDWEVLDTWDHDIEGSEATIDFTDIPASEFDEFELTWKDVNTSTTSNSIEVRFSNDNGATFDAGTNYAEGLDVLNSETAFSEVRGTAVDAIQMTGSFGSTSVRLSHGVCRFGPLDSGARKWIWFSGLNINDSGNMRLLEGAGYWYGTGSDGVVTAFRLILGAGGNFTGGKFTLRGRRKV